MKTFRNILLYLSAFVPMYLLILVRLLLEIVNANLTFNVLNTINLITLLLLIGGGVIGLWWNVWGSKDESRKIVILSKKNITDQHFLGYFSLFVFFAIPLDLSKVSIFCVYALTLIFIGIVYINNSLYYINPLLNIMGFNFYDIEYEDVSTGQKHSTKIFYKGELEIENKVYSAKIKNTHFCFIERENKKNSKKS